MITWDEFERTTLYGRPFDWELRPQGPDWLDLWLVEAWQLGWVRRRWRGSWVRGYGVTSCDTECVVEPPCGGGQRSGARPVAHGAGHHRFAVGVSRTDRELSRAALYRSLT